MDDIYKMAFIYRYRRILTMEWYYAKKDQITIT